MGDVQDDDLLSDPYEDWDGDEELSQSTAFPDSATPHLPFNWKFDFEAISQEPPPLLRPPSEPEADLDVIDGVNIYDKILTDMATEVSKRKDALNDLGIWSPDAIETLQSTQLPGATACLLHDENERVVSKATDRSIPILFQAHTRMEDQNADAHLGAFPRYLLHVETMTTHAWSPGNWYSSSQAPPYCAISYTWGRWELGLNECLEVKALPVTGTKWLLPRVKEDIFTASQLHEIIKNCAEIAGTEWIWIDIACINQDRLDPEYNAEIGRQASIFRSARTTFIWLLPDPEAKAPVDMDVIVEVLSYHASRANTRLEELSALQSKLGFMHSKSKRQSEIPNIHAQIADVTMLLQNLNSQPWFSSLWTLQEAFLRPDAHLLNPDGRSVCIDDDRPVLLNDLLDWCSKAREIVSSLLSIKRICADKDDFHERVLAMTIKSSGLEALASRNPMALYACAFTRRPKYEEDRVYGIMQVFNFRLGKARISTDKPGTSEESNENWTLADLELNLGIELLHERPLLSQLFAHTGSVSRRQGWRVSGSSATPCLMKDVPFDSFGQLAIDQTMHAKLSVQWCNGIPYGHFAGSSCPFEHWCEDWKNHQYRNEEVQSRCCMHLSLDTTAVFNETTMQTPHQLYDFPRTVEAQSALADLILRKTSDHGLEIGVWLLGELHGHQHDFHQIVGVLVIQAYDEQIGPWSKRIGICMWDSDMSLDLPSSFYADAASTSELWSWKSSIFG